MSAEKPGNGITVREAVASDDHPVGELLVESFVEAYGRKMPEVIVDDERKRDLRDVAGKRKVASVLVIEKSGRIIGTATLYPPGAVGTDSWLPDAANLRYLAVSRLNRGEGISGILIQAAEETARSGSIPRIVLHVRRGAVGVAGVYIRHGYGRVPTADRDLPSIYLEAYLKNL